MTRLLLIRHGESRSGVDGVIGGHRGCAGLTDLGRAQACLLRDRLRRIEMPAPDAIVTSILPRAIETAAIVAAGFDAPPPTVQDCGVCELHPGEGDGLTHAEFAARYGLAQLDDPAAPMSPGGESRVTFDRRIRATMGALIAAREGQTVMIVSHGGFISGACLFLLGGPGLGERRSGAFFSPQHVSITEFARPDPSEAWTFVRYNDAAHLEARSTGTTSSM